MTTISRIGNRTGERPGEQGFTLIELVLVLLVMTLVAAITYPAMMRGRAAFHLRTVARDVIGSVRFARETAVTEQRVMLLQVDSQTQKVIVSDDVGDGARAYTLPSDVKIQGLTPSGSGAGVTRESQGEETLKIRFLPNGSSDSAQMLLTADTGATLKIVTDPITGAAHVVPDEGVKTP